MGLARGIGLAVRKLDVNVLAAAELGVCEPVPRVWGVPSSEEGSGVPGRLFCELKLGLRREVRDGEGGRGVGGRL